MIGKSVVGVEALFIFLMGGWFSMAVAAPNSSGAPSDHKPPTQSSSGFASGVAAASPIPTAALPTHGAKTETGTGAAASSAAASSQPSGPLTLNDNDLGQPTPLGPLPTPVPASRGDLRVTVNGREISPTEYAIIVAPQEEVTMAVELSTGMESTEFQPPASVDVGKPRIYEFFETLRTTWRMEVGAILQRGKEGLRWQAPNTTGSYRVGATLNRQSRFEDTSMTALQAAARKEGVEGSWSAVFIVRAPFDPKGDGIVDGYTIGIYPNPETESSPAPVRDHAAAYAPPAFVVPVTPETARMYLTPHWRLGDFSAPEELNKKHYIALNPRLVEFLEKLCERLNSEELDGDNLIILRGYVSPYNRQRLVREGADLVPFSRFQYGDCATLIIDANQDGVMDDLNGDGVIDILDADRLADSVDFLQRQGAFPGGVGVYSRNDDPKNPDTPCVQVDLRGWRERWRRAQ